MALRLELVNIEGSFLAFVKIVWLNFSHPEGATRLFLFLNKSSAKNVSKFKTVLQIIEKHNH